MRDLVLSKSTPTEGLLKKWAADHEIPREDRDGFVKKGLQLMINLSEGTAGRYRISLEELEEWRDATALD